MSLGISMGVVVQAETKIDTSNTWIMFQDSSWIFSGHSPSMHGMKSKALQIPFMVKQVTSPHTDCAQNTREPP
jgi:hypothetical protein